MLPSRFHVLAARSSLDLISLTLISCTGVVASWAEVAGLVASWTEVAGLLPPGLKSPAWLPPGLKSPA